MNIVVVGARERPWTDKDRDTVEELLQRLWKQYGARFYAVSVGCDRGIGKYVKEFCLGNKIIFTENRMKMEGEFIPRPVFVQMFLARNASLLEVGDEFYVFKGPYESGIIEALVEPAKKKVGPHRVTTYPFESDRDLAEFSVRRQLITT